ncbi:MAG: DUF835 domain-containing protein [Euryarchaeota archaeon]
MGVHIRSKRWKAMFGFNQGKIYALNLVSQRDLLAHIDKISSKDEGKVVFISRLPHRRLIEHFDLEKVESYWLTKQDSNGSLSPELSTVYDKISEIISKDVDLLVMEGCEWLISMHGFDDFYTMVIDLKDLIYDSSKSILFSLAVDVLDEINLSKWQEATINWTLPELVNNSIQSTDETVDVVEESHADLQNESLVSTLRFLTPINREGYSKEILRKRILQWRRMGLDVSELDTSLFTQDDDLGYSQYKQVEEKVRRAIELDNRLDLLDSKGWKSDVIKLRFRIRQLTGFDDVEKRIDEII